MNVSLLGHVKSEDSEALGGVLSPRDEFLVYCPQCKTLETLWFSNGSLSSGRKFSQVNSEVYHDCGSRKACRVYRM